jgi:hypothetical protein
LSVDDQIIRSTFTIMFTFAIFRRRSASSLSNFRLVGIRTLVAVVVFDGGGCSSFSCVAFLGAFFVAIFFRQ